MATRFIDRTLREEWYLGVAPDASPLAAGVAQVVTTGIQLPNDTSMSESNAARWDKALDECHVFYQETSNIGGAVVGEADIVLSASAAGILLVTLTNSGAPGSLSAGKMKVVKDHSLTL